MTTSLQLPITMKLILSSLVSFLIVTVFFITKTDFSTSSFQPVLDKTILISNSSTKTKVHNLESVSCGKIPPSLADALIHYAASNTTPQQTLSEISITKKVLDKTSPCNFLVFGLGHDSLMWTSLNHGGRTIFLEEDESWIRNITEHFPSLESYHVRYDTKVRNAAAMLSTARESEECRHGVSMDLRASRCELALKSLPKVVYEMEWDLIMVDAPTGFHEEAPGRMSAIYTAGMMARSRKRGETTAVFVHDVDRPVEDEFTMEFLCRDYMTEEQGRLRHFTVPSHRNFNIAGGKFCP
ncbi:unnamed protein product [Eruca vesicaria subsp. sativa]|uniref:Polysaccharide biosynthesis domain-containing protein n=1 Tax=Eruca vesicaria subsp. sativa TaxID=29727 RepID=A0ABC8JSY9_ERUVS|nr:unnamed protein product [Eruca vesicaria subsp. sativa]